MRAKASRERHIVLGGVFKQLKDKRSSQQHLSLFELRCLWHLAAGSPYDEQRGTKLESIGTNSDSKDARVIDEQSNPLSALLLQNETSRHRCAEWQIDGGEEQDQIPS